MKKIISVCFFLLAAVCLSSCTGNKESNAPASQDPVTVQPTEEPSLTPEPTLTFTPEPTFTPTVTPIVILPPDPVEVSFTTADSVDLKGKYYPASENPAPLIILVHWARGDMSEWEPIAFWLQNRGQLDRKADYNYSWKSSDWFPDISVDGPLGIFVFTLRECDGGCRSYLPGGWLKDVEAAMSEAAQLQGVDKENIMTVGASIGADGALYGCAWMNQVGFGSCKGSFSLSPASLLTVPFDELANQLIGAEPSVPLYCLFGLRDDASVETCSSINGLTSVDYGYIEDHGLELIKQGRDPDPLLLMVDFINLSLSGAGEGFK